MNLAIPPANIRAIGADRVLELTWTATRISPLPFRLLREECPCAACVNEFTGERILDRATVPDDIRPRDVSLVGNYALKIVWSDGHDSGLFTWDQLSELSDRISQEPA